MHAEYALSIAVILQVNYLVYLELRLSYHTDVRATDLTAADFPVGKLISASSPYLIGTYYTQEVFD
jgi:hypothetical protein